MQTLFHWTAASLRRPARAGDAAARRCRGGPSSRGFRGPGGCHRTPAGRGASGPLSPSTLGGRDCSGRGLILRLGGTVASGTGTRGISCLGTASVRTFPGSIAHDLGYHAGRGTFTGTAAAASCHCHGPASPPMSRGGAPRALRTISNISIQRHSCIVNHHTCELADIG